MNTQLLTRKLASRESTDSSLLGALQLRTPPTRARRRARRTEHVAEEDHAEQRGLRERVHRLHDAAAGEEGAEQAQRVGEPDQHQVPGLQHVALFLDHHRVQVRGGGEPRHEATRSRPGPRPSSRPSRAPRRPSARRAGCRWRGRATEERPAPRGAEPRAAELARGERRERERERHDEARQARVEHQRVDHHHRVLEQRVQALRRRTARGRAAASRRDRHEDEQHQEEDRVREQHRAHPGHQGGLAAVAPARPRE